MRTIIFKIISSILIITVILFCYLRFKTCYLNFCVQKDVENIAYVEIFMNNGLSDRTIYYTDREIIENLFEYLNEIPLTYEPDENCINKAEGVYIRINPYDTEGIDKGWVVIKGDYIQRITDLKVFKIREKNISVMDYIEELEKSSTPRNERPIERFYKDIEDENGEIKTVVELIIRKEDGTEELVIKNE